MKTNIPLSKIGFHYVPPSRLEIDALVRLQHAQDDEIEACKKLLGYTDGSLLSIVQRFKAFSEHEIALLRSNNEAAIRAIEKLT